MWVSVVDNQLNFQGSIGETAINMEAFQKTGKLILDMMKRRLKAKVNPSGGNCYDGIGGEVAFNRRCPLKNRTPLSVRCSHDLKDVLTRSKDLTNACPKPGTT